MFTVYMVYSPKETKFYYGQTNNTLKTRLSSHKDLAVKRMKNCRIVSPFYTWLHSRLDDVIIEQICQVQTREEADEIERALISVAKSIGIDCLNKKQGGSTNRVLLINLNDLSEQIFESTKGCAQFLGFDSKCVRRCMLGQERRVNKNWIALAPDISDADKSQRIQWATSITVRRTRKDKGKRRAQSKAQ